MDAELWGPLLGGAVINVLVLVVLRSGSRREHHQRASAPKAGPPTPSAGGRRQWHPSMGVAPPPDAPARIALETILAWRRLDDQGIWDEFERTR